MSTTLAVLYQDDDLVAVYKPAGMMVHRSMIAHREQQLAMTLLRNQLQQWVYPVHRLDRATSGVLLFALNKNSARILSKEFESRKVKKKYLALVRGKVENGGLIDKALKEKLDRIADKNSDISKSNQSAITEYKPLATVELPYQVSKYPTSRYSLVSLYPKTGRRHQLRRHMHHISHPIIGDTTYGDGKHNRFFRKKFNCSELMLCAMELSFLHPVTTQSLTISSPLSKNLKKLILEFGWQSHIPENML